MANALFPKTKAKMLAGLINLSTANVKAILLDAGYSYSAAHEFVSSIAAGARVAMSGNLAGKVIDPATGAFDSNDVTFPAVSGDVVVALALYIDTGSEASSPLLLFQDTGIVNAPLTPNGNDITITVGATGWFTL